MALWLERVMESGRVFKRVGKLIGEGQLFLEHFLKVDDHPWMEVLVFALEFIPSDRWEGRVNAFEADRLKDVMELWN